MLPAPIPSNEAERLAALRSYDILASQRNESLDAICRVVSSIFGSAIALVSITDVNRQVVKGRVGPGPDELARALAPCAYAILGETPMVIEDMARDERFTDNPLLAEPNNVRFYVGAPLFTPDRLALGTLCAIDTRAQRPSAEKLAALSDLSETVMTLLNLRKAMSRARGFALTDALTGLANRPGLMLELETIMEHSGHDGSPFALLYIDVDNFKYVNDTRGHATGDELLQLIGETLRRCVRLEDTPGRLGGDEFVILVPRSDPGEAAKLAERFFEQLTTVVAVYKYPVTFSIGVACFAQPPPNVHEALLIADRLMYTAKHGGKNRIVTLSADRFGVGA